MSLSVVELSDGLSTDVDIDWPKSPNSMGSGAGRWNHIIPRRPLKLTDPPTNLRQPRFPVRLVPRHIMHGKIGVRGGVGVDRHEKHAVVLSAGSTLEADAVVYATGFGSMGEWVARLIDRPTADRVGRCWGYGSGHRNDLGPWEGDIRNMRKPTAQPGLWFMGGNLAQARMYSHYLSLQLQ